MLLLAAFVQGRRDLLASALEDRMHQPYRASLCPLLPALQKVAGHSPGILGAVLSGAGPSVLVFLGEKGKDGKGREKKEKDQKVKDGKVSAERAVAQVSAYLRAHGLKAELISTAITRQGAGQGRAWVKRRS
jgi:homoserine kinase